MNRTGVDADTHDVPSGNRVPPAPTGPAGDAPAVRPVLSYLNPGDEEREEQSPPYGIGLLEAIGGFLAAVWWAAVGLALGGFASQIAGHGWLLAVGPIALTVLMAIPVVRASSRSSQRGFRDGFLAGTIIVLVVVLRRSLA